MDAFTGKTQGLKMDSGLVYVGKIIALEPIENADFIVSATVVCGKGGKWKGIVRKNQFEISDLCNVYLPDAQIPPNEAMQFMEKSKWRVKMCRFKGAPSEVLIMPMPPFYADGMEIGDDLTEWFGVTKYHKPIPANLQGKAIGEFPSFIPKTDEPNYQRVPELIEALKDQSYYVAEKADGSSTTAYRYKDKFGVCSRNWELARDLNNGYWQVAIEHGLEEKLPEGIALQWETCGPKIQSNPMGLTKVQGFLFSAYDIQNQKYLEYKELMKLSGALGFPCVNLLPTKQYFDSLGLEQLAQGTYKNGKPREGVVIRSQHNLLGNKPISFKIINLDYEK